MKLFSEPLNGIYWQNGLSNSEVVDLGESNHDDASCYMKSYNGSFSDDFIEGSCVGNSYRVCKKEINSDNCFLDGFTINPVIKVIQEAQDSTVFECRQLCQEHDNCAIATYRKGSKLCQLHDHGM